MVRVAVLNEDKTIAIVYELDHFMSLGMHEDQSINWVVDRNMEAFQDGSYIDGTFYLPEPCIDCMENHPV
jgi:hypothetical protein